MIQVPGYLIKREIGKGGMATVYLAVQASLDRDVALKVMQPALANDPNFSRRFLQEARTLASLSHPNIVAVYDVGVTEAQLHYFAMQHLPGGDFAHRIRAGVDQTEVVRVLAGVARALAFAHQRGFVHRDVSPANILFDASEHPILTDFGIARAVARTSRLTNAGVSVGTSHYMSPEQARGADVDARSDIYSLGCVTYEALTGKAPYSGEDGFAIAYAHVFEPIPRLAPELAHWQPLIDRALAKNAADRFATLDEFLEALAGVGAAPLPAEPAPEPELFDDSDFLASDPARTQQIPAALLDAIPTPAPAPAPAAAVPEARAARESVSSRPPRAMPLRGIGIAAAVVVLAALVAWLVMRGPDPGDRAAAAVTAATPAVAAPAPAVDTIAATPALDAPPPVLDASTPPADAAAAPAIAIEPSIDDAEALRNAVATTVVDPIGALLALGQADLSAQRYTQPAGRNALERYRLAESLAERRRAPRDVERARQGIAAVAEGYVALADKRLGERNEPEFIAMLARADEIARSVPQGAPVAARVRERRAGHAKAAVDAGNAATLAWDQAAAVAAFERALVFDPGSAAAKQGLARARRIGQVGYVFRDAAGPELVIANAGGGTLAVARTETTLGEFRRYWKARGARARGGDRPACRDRESFFRGGSKARNFESPGFAQAASHPVVCVSWDDAADYARWLSEQTGKRYRLPLAKEWTAFARGAPAAGGCRANVGDARYRAAHDARDAHPCDDGHAGTAPVASYDATPAGIHDAAGNVREWLGDCAQGCREHAAIGSAWSSGRDKPDPMQRVTLASDVASNTVGFRVVRELD